MAQSGYTPISLYFSATGAAVPSAGNLVAGELALNTNDGKLYYKNSSGVVTLLAGATSGPAGGSTTQVQYNNAGVLGGITGATTNGTALTLVAPVLGIPASGTLTNATGLPISTGVSGLGTGVATFLATPSSANLAAAVTDETGSGVLVFGTSPTFTTSVLGGATMAVFNTVSTTVNAFGAATTLNIGNASMVGGTAYLYNGSFAGTLLVTGSLTMSISGAGSQGGSVANTNAAAGAWASWGISNGTRSLKLATLSTGWSGTFLTGGPTTEQSAIYTDGNIPIVFGINSSMVGQFSSTGLAVTGTLSATLDATIYGVTVGRGGGAVSTNTAVGASALEVNISGGSNTAVGYQAQYKGNSAYHNTSLGYQSLYTNINAPENTAIGYQSLFFATAGGNTAVGFQSAYTTAGGYQNSVLGDGALYTNESGALNTAVGYKALYTNNTSNNTAVGYQAGHLSTGAGNQFFGYSSGSAVTLGAKNVIVGSYTGSAAPISATGSNYVVLSDGDGNVRGYFDSSGIYYVLGTHGQMLCGTTTTSGNFSNSTGGAGISFYGATHATVPNKVVVTPGTNGVYMNAGATAWTAVSDERFKDIIEPISDAVIKVSSLRAVIGKFKTDEENVRRSFLIAQDVQAVLPEAIDATNPDQLGVAYTDVIPLLVAAIKELKSEFDAYKLTHP